MNCKAMSHSKEMLVPFAHCRGCVRFVLAFCVAGCEQAMSRTTASCVAFCVAGCAPCLVFCLAGCEQAMSRAMFYCGPGNRMGCAEGTPGDLRPLGLRPKT